MSVAAEPLTPWKLLSRKLRQRQHVGINRLFYQFPVGDKVTVTFGGRVRQDDMLAMWPSVYPADTVLDVFTYAGSPGCLQPEPGCWCWCLVARQRLELQHQLRVPQTATTATPTKAGIGTDGSSQTFTAQLGYAGENFGALWLTPTPTASATPPVLPLLLLHGALRWLCAATTLLV